VKILWLVTNENQVVDRHCVDAGDLEEERKLVTVYLVKFSETRCKFVDESSEQNDHDQNEPEEHEHDKETSTKHRQSSKVCYDEHANGRW
jgi:hypothetical protein